ncbi:siroheme synthase CysG [Phreatobacter cathodiphilus]|uniref:Uroporphyrinogen-III C-methyltransferase n=1 Tax=Phreatobacter cathodiphilus TaxID=1868589 RepID=A0A2S0N940_9HYPH|nr:siroheme synthase CysG [Phreatobacter cathodiphilus]AVO44652.1 uroporphyrinogen-III C-methyltransferase [Phreatobacter cathodiphilus]
MTTSAAPRGTEPARIGAIATLPLFHKLRGRRVVLAGDSEGASWKAELLAAAGADLHVFAPASPGRFHHVAASDGGGVHVHERAWTPGDLDGAALAVADVESDEEAAAFAAAARAAGAVANVVDRPAFCDAQFGALVNRSPLLVAISTDGAAPVFGQAVRARIEALLPRGLQAWAQAARDWRPLVQARGAAFSLRRAFWQRFTDLAFSAPERAPAEADRDALLAGLDRQQAAPPEGRVLLVGAGPGDPDLLTLKALRALQSADVILYDNLVTEGVLELARREARRVAVGKVGHGPSVSQADINELMVSLAREGRTVVRLKSGDPAIFGRANEEMAACRAAGVPFAIVPGITAAQGAASALGLSLTDRDFAQRLQFVTGHSRKGELPESINWSAIADPAATTIIYMPRHTLRRFAARALESGLAGTTPALAIAAATRPDEVHVAAAIADLPDRVEDLPAALPVLVVIGEAVRGVREAAATRAAEVDAPA